MRSLTWAEVRGRRLTRSHLLAPAPSERLVDVVGAVCGAQAQVITAAELAIGARVAGVTQADVRRELWERRRLVKTYSLRGTLHLHPADELPLWTAARRARPGGREGRWHDSYQCPSREPGRPRLAAVQSDNSPAGWSRCVPRSR